MPDQTPEQKTLAQKRREETEKAEKESRAARDQVARLAQISTQALGSM